MPYVNGKFYMNPSFGRAVENARRAAATSHQYDQRDHEARWVTIAGRHILIGKAQTQRGLSVIRDRIVAAARIHDGSSDWAVDKQKDNFAPGTDKCNKFVYDVTKEAGAKAIVIGRDGKLRPPLAAEWADVKTRISGWRVLGPTEMPRPGDCGLQVARACQVHGAFGHRHLR